MPVITKKSILLALLLSGILFPSFTTAQTVAGDSGPWRQTLEDTGDVLEYAIPISAGLLTLLKKDYKGSKQFALSYATTWAVTYSLKHIIRKERPESARNHLRYDSFPSGHTASAFSGASFLQRRYGWEFGVPAYALATLVGVSRIEGPVQHHDVWDVLAGAAIGIGATYMFTTPQEKGTLQVSYLSGDGMHVVGLSYSF